VKAGARDQRLKKLNALNRSMRQFARRKTCQILSTRLLPPELLQKRRALAPDIEAAFDAFSQRVFADGALPAKTKQVIAVG
jgi:hypothetical protein